MNKKLTQYEVPTTAGGTIAVDVTSNVQVVYIKPASSITLNAALNVTVSGTPKEYSYVEFLYGGDITSTTSTGKVVTIFGTSLNEAQSKYEATITAFYINGAWEIRINADEEAGNSNIDGANLEAGSVPRGAIEDNAIDNDKLNSLARGYIKVGDSASAPTDLDAGGDAKILVGDANNDLNSVAMSGDGTITSAGVFSIGDGKVTDAMLASAPSDFSTLSLTISSAQLLSLNSSPLTIIAAPGAGKAIKPWIGYTWLDYNTATYAGGGQLELRFGSDIIGSSVVANVTNGSDILGSIAGAGGGTSSTLNQALLLSNAAADFTAGDSVLQIVLYYSIIDFNY